MLAKKPVTTNLLGLLLNQEGFIPTQKDLSSLLLAYSAPSADFELLKRRQACLKLLTQSYRMHMIYESMSYSTKSALIKGLSGSLVILARPFLREAVVLALTGELHERPAVLDRALALLTLEDWEYAQY